jgi:hypothetical protein
MVSIAKLQVTEIHETSRKAECYYRGRAGIVDIVQRFLRINIPEIAERGKCFIA